VNQNMNQEPLTVGKLKQYFIDKKVPDDAVINVLNRDGELTANIEPFFENLETRKWVFLEGGKPFWKIREEETANKE
jgi:hypothetical protein